MVYKLLIFIECIKRDIVVYGKPVVVQRSEYCKYEGHSWLIMGLLILCHNTL